MYLKLPKEMLSYNSRVNMARDKTFFMKFVIENPYPEYEEVIKIIKNEDHRMYLDMFAEYGMDNHKWMKYIYENILEKGIVRKNGELINERGDKTAMVYNYYTILSVVNHFLRKAKRKMKEDDIIFIQYNFKDIISSYWDGIGDWRH